MPQRVNLSIFGSTGADRDDCHVVLRAFVGWQADVTVVIRTECSHGGSSVKVCALMLHPSRLRQLLLR